MEQGNLQPQFGIERIYLKDISFQVVNAPEVYSDSRRYDVGLNINSASRQVSAEVYEVVLTVVATAKQGEAEVFKGVVSEGGSFVIRNVKPDQRDAILGVACPNILLPYAREMIADLSTRAGFSPVMIQPVDFEAVFLQQREQTRQQAGQGAPLQ
jgi:preprotein translocase subunit SecB